MVNVKKTIRKETTKIVKKVVDPVKKEAQKATSEITKLQNMVKCPVSVTSNFPTCATNYLLDLVGYLIFGAVNMVRVPWVVMLNFIIWMLNWFIVPGIRAVINFCMELLMRPDWKLNGSFSIPYFDWFLRHKNDVIRIVNTFFPFFNRTKYMSKCYCASSLVWLFQPLQVKEQTWMQWLESLFDPILHVAKWMFSAYTESFTGEDTVAVSMAPIIVAVGMVCIFLLFFATVAMDEDT